jgi:hypothetical protein
MNPDLGGVADASVDSSSFFITRDGGFDSIAFRRVRYDESGFYEGIEQISWFVKNGSLFRNCKVIEKKAGLSLTDDICSDGENSTPINVEMASGVTEFTLTPSKPSALGDDVQIFPAIGTTEFKLVPRKGDLGYVAPIVSNENNEQDKGGAVQVISNFFSNYSTSTEEVVVESNRKVNEVILIKNETTTESSWKTLCADYGRLRLIRNRFMKYRLKYLIREVMMIKACCLCRARIICLWAYEIFRPALNPWLMA